MTHPLVSKYFTISAQLDAAKADLMVHAKRQVEIMKEIIEGFNSYELKSDRRYSGLFSYEFIQLDTSCGRVTITIWEDAYADIPEENVGEFELSDHILEGNDSEFRLEYEATAAKIDEAIRERAWAQRQAEIAQARATLDRLERMPAAIASRASSLIGRQS
jgi:hypothetical protein